MEFCNDSIVNYYNEFRTAIFLSSLTLGTFLFTMKSFIVSTMKTQVFDTPSYQDEVTARIASGENDQYYGPLKSFTRLMSWSIWMALGNALVQLILGVSDNAILVVVCASTTLLSWALVVIVLRKVSANLINMIDRAEKVAVERQANLEGTTTD